MEQYEVGALLHHTADTEASRRPLAWDAAAIDQVHLRIDRGVGAVSAPTSEEIEQARSNVEQTIASAVRLAKAAGEGRIGKDVVMTLFSARDGIWPWT